MRRTVTRGKGLATRGPQDWVPTYAARQQRATRPLCAAWRRAPAPARANPAPGLPGQPSGGPAAGDTPAVRHLAARAGARGGQTQRRACPGNPAAGQQRATRPLCATWRRAPAPAAGKPSGGPAAGDTPAVRHLAARAGARGGQTQRRASSGRRARCAPLGGARRRPRRANPAARQQRATRPLCAAWRRAPAPARANRCRRAGNCSPADTDNP